MQLFVKYRILFKISGILGLLLMVGCSGKNKTASEETTSTEEATAEDFSESTETENKRRSEPMKDSINTLNVVWSQADAIESGLEWSIQEEEEDKFWLEISGIGLKDVLGLAFHLTYNAEVIELIESTSTEILRDNFTDIATVIRDEPGTIHFGSVRLHDAGNYGQPTNYTGLDIEKGVIARFQFMKKSTGDLNIELPDAGRDLRNSELSRLSLNTRVGTATIDDEVSR